MKYILSNRLNFFFLNRSKGHKIKEAHKKIDSSNIVCVILIILLYSATIPNPWKSIFLTKLSNLPNSILNGELLLHFFFFSWNKLWFNLKKTVLDIAAKSRLSHVKLTFRKRFKILWRQIYQPNSHNEFRKSIL